VICVAGKKGQIPWNKGLKGVKKHSEVTKRKIGMSHLGKKYNISEKSRKIMADTARNTLLNHSEISRKGGLNSPTKFKKGHIGYVANLGRKFDEEWRKKLSISHKGKISPKKGIKLNEEQKQNVRLGILKNYEKHPELRDILREKRLKQIIPLVDTKIEIIIQKELDKRNIIYIKHPSMYICQPDLFIPSINVVIFADGCYWHGCKTCFKKDYKIGGVSIKQIRQRDNDVSVYLKARGYNVVRIWEHDIKFNLEKCIDNIIGVEIND